VTASRIEVSGALVVGLDNAIEVINIGLSIVIRGPLNDIHSLFLAVQSNVLGKAIPEFAFRQ